MTRSVPAVTTSIASYVYHRERRVSSSSAFSGCPYFFRLSCLVIAPATRSSLSSVGYLRSPVIWVDVHGFRNIFLLAIGVASIERIAACSRVKELQKLVHRDPRWQQRLQSARKKLAHENVMSSNAGGICKESKRLPKRCIEGRLEMLLGVPSFGPYNEFLPCF